MENSSTLQSKIGFIDEEISDKYQQEFQARENGIDFTGNNWAEEMKHISMAYRKAIEPELVFARRIIKEAMEENDYNNITEIGELLKKTKQLKKFITPTLDELANNTKDNLLLCVALFIGKNLEPDARDSMIWFGELIQFCENRKIDLKPILQKLLPYTSTDIKFGEYSMRVLFRQAIERSGSQRKRH